MPIEKLPEFAKDGQKNTDELDLETGFIVNRKPARQWFNWLFNTLALKINDVIDKKLDSDANAVSATKLATARIISFSGAATGSVNYDGSDNSSCILTLANSGVVANTYGSNLKIPTITVNAKGLITDVSEQQIPIVDDLTTGGSAKLLSAEQGKLLQANKLDKTALNNTLTSTSTVQALTAAQGKALNDKLIGVGQSWQNVTEIRFKNTTYINSTSKPIEVAASFPDTNSGSPFLSVIVGGVTIIEESYDTGTTIGSTNVSFIVPPGATYSINLTSIGLISRWSELR